MRTQIPGTQILDSTIGTVDLGDGVVTTAKLDMTGVNPGIFTQLTVNAQGRVTAGASLTTIAGYGITDAQALNAALTTLSAFTTTGLYTITATGTALTRAIAAGSSKISIANGSGVAGNPTLDLVEANVNINNLGGTLAPIKGGTGLSALGAISTVLGMNVAGTALEYKTISAGAGISTTFGIGTLIITNTGVLSVAATAPSSGMTIAAGGTASNPTLTFAFTNNLGAIETVATTGFAVRTAANAWSTRAISGSAGRITVTNGDGVAAAPVLDLAAAGTAGSYVMVTTDAYGRVLSGAATLAWSALTGTPTTLGGYGITDAQGLNANLTALANTTTTGIRVITGPGTAAARTLVAGSTKIAIVNGDGVAGNPSIDVTEANLTLNNLAGTLSSAKGGTGLTGIGTANQVLGVNGTASALEYKTVQAGAGITVTAGANSILISAVNSGTVTSVSAAGSTGISVTGSPITGTGTLTFTLGAELQGLSTLAASGIVVRTAAGTYAARSITSSGTITIANALGTAGNIALDLTAAGTAGTYKSVSTDSYGRVTSGTNPTTLAGYGITDAVNVLQLGAPSGVATLGSDGKLTGAQLPAIAISNSYVVGSQTAQTALTANIGDVAIRTDLNKSYILHSLPASTFANWQELLTPTNSVTSVNGLTGAVSVGTVTSVNAVQPAQGIVITGGPITTAGSLTFTLSNDIGAVEALTTFGIAVRTGTDTWSTRALGGTTGRVLITNGDGVLAAPAIDLAAVGTAGTYAQVTTDPYGRVTAGSTTLPFTAVSGLPTTLGGYGITDAQPLNANLTALSGVFAALGAGLYAVTGAGTAATRVLTAGSTKVSVVNGNAVAGNPTVDVTEANLTLNNIGGTLAAAKGGTGLAALGTANQVLGMNGGASALEYKSIIAGSGITVTQGVGSITVASTFASTVTSVALALPGVFVVTGSPVTSSGTLTAAFASQSASTVLAGPASGAAATPAFRTLALKELNDVLITTPVQNQALTYNGTAWVNTSATATSATGLLSAWTLVSGSRYYADFAHNLGTNNIVIMLYDTADNSVVAADSMILTNTNTVRITIIGNTKTIRIVVLANGLTINTAVQSAGTITTASNGVNVSAVAARLNFQGQATTVVDAGAGTTNITIGSRFTFFANSLDTPVNADWAIPAAAALTVDTVNASLTVRSFSNTAEQGVGFMIAVPTGATQITFKYRGRAATAQATASVVQPRVYSRLIPNGGAVGAWSAASELANVAIPANAFFQYATQTMTLAALGLTAGNSYQIELTRRVVGVTGTNLPAAFFLVELTVEVA